MSLGDTNLDSVPQDIDSRKGAFLHPYIADLVLEVWFPPRTSALGAIFQHAFNPIPHPLIALVLTTVRLD